MFRDDFIRAPLWRKSLLLALLLALTLIGGGVSLVRAALATTHTVTLRSHEDVYVLQSQPSDNFGAGPIGVVADSEGYVQFDLSALPPAGITTIDEATLRLKPSDIVGDPPSQVVVGRVDERWFETTATWDTRPDTTFGENSPSASISNYDWVEWDVTALVRQWHDGTLTNFGFALRTDDPGVYFHSKETGTPPQLVIKYTVDDDEPDKPRSDLGDAPDSTNHHGINNVAYPGAGVAGQFPTVYDTPAGQPAGPKHRNETMQAILGEYISREGEADVGADGDGPNNILKFGTTVDPTNANADRGDDGWQNRWVAFPNCRRTTLVVRVRKDAAATVEQMYLNVWFDGNRDGDWADVGVCRDDDTGQEARSYEWIVQDYEVDLTAIVTDYVDIPVTTLLLHNPTPDRPHWMRFTLSEQRAPHDPEIRRADGRGPSMPDLYLYGETEDVVQVPAPAGEPGTLLLTKAVELPSTPVVYGGTVTYTINLKHQGGTTALPASLWDQLDYPLHLLGPVEVTEVADGVTPLHAQVLYRRDDGRRLNTLVRWRGTLAPDAEVQLAFPVHVHPFCKAGEETKEIVNAVQLRKPDGVAVDDQSVDTVAFRAACPGYDLSDIEVEQELITGDEGGATVSAAQADEAALLLPAVQAARSAAIRATFTNKSDQPITLGVFPKVEIHFNDPAARTGDANRVLTPEPSLVTVPPGESLPVEYRADLSQLLDASTADIPDDPAAEVIVRSAVRYAILSPDLPLVPLESLDEGLVGEHHVDFPVRPYDFGDAPDSTNHVGVGMDAYPGVPANFPTVFDPATDPGGPQGPAHARPRPFHLGRGVEMEADADLLPVPRNIDPSTNVANRDRYDDGLRLSSVSFAHCQTATLQAQIFIHPAAIARFQELGIESAYVNVWVDGNRDGDWADGTNCPDQQTALEHIVIDRTIPIASLTPGLNNVSIATTGPVLWPDELKDRPAWLRITLSERESNKTLETNGVKHGDGRGHSAPFRTGETEDYLLRPASAGPDLSLDGDVTWEPVIAADDPGRAAAVSLNFEEIKVTYRLHLRNLGGAAAAGTEIELGEALPEGAEVRGYVVNPELQKWIELDTGDNIFGFGTLPPGGAAVLMVSYVTGFDGKGNDVLTEEVVFAARSNQTDADSSDNELHLRAEIAPLVPGFGWQSLDAGETARTHCDPFCPPLTATVRLLGTGATVRNAVQMQGTARPGATLVVGMSGSSGDRAARTHWGQPLTATVTAGDDGTWSYDWAGLGSGANRLFASYASTPLARLDKASPKLAEAIVTVCPDLPFDPASLRMMDAEGHLATTSWVAYECFPKSWKVEEGESYLIGVRATSRSTQNLALTIYIDDTIVGLRDEDGDGFYTGELTVPASDDARSSSAIPSLTLSAEANGVETTYTSDLEATTPGVVRDAASGALLDGATVTLLEQVAVDAAGARFTYVNWNGAAVGQANPQTTSGDGAYSFVPEEGTYRVLVQKEGYQSHRSAALNVSNGGANVSVALTPETGPADVEIAITDGGFEPATLTVPPGTTVRWVNVDAAEHSVASAAWESGILASGEGYSVTVAETGSIPYEDSITGSVGTITVDANATPPGTSFLYVPSVMK